MLNSLWSKISLGIVLLIAVIMAMVTYIFTISQINTQRRELRSSMSRVARQIASIRLAETAGWYVYQDWIDNILNSEAGKDLVYISVANEKDSLVAFSLNIKWLDLSGGAYVDRDEQAEIVTRLAHGQIAKESQQDFDHLAVAIRWGNESLGTVDVGFSLIEFNNAIRRRLLINLELLAIFSVLGVLGSVLMSRRITSPLNDLSKAMLAVSAGNLDQKVHIRSHDEIGDLSRSFDNMIAGLREKAVIEQFTRELGFTFELEKVAQWTTEFITKAIHAQSGAFFWIDQQERERMVRLAWCHPAMDDLKNIAFQLNPLKHGALLKEKKLFELGGEGPLNDLLQSVNSIAMQSRQPVFHLIAPVAVQDRLLGFLLLSSKSNESPYLSEEKRFLITLITQAALAIENATLLRELTDRERMKKELEIARQVQKRFLPTRQPRLNGLDISGVCIPATEVGGDYYDFFVFNSQKIGIVIADVSGKGTSAAFYMAEIKGMMSSLVYIIDSPKEVISRVNQRLYESTDRRIFATMVYGVLDLEKRRLTFVRAGHNALLIKRGVPERQVEIAIPLGMGLGLTHTDVFAQNTEEKTVELDEGDSLLFYTDGISEAMQKGYEQFGEERLAELLLNSDGQSAQALQAHVLDQVSRFVDRAPQHDDMTMVIARLE
jgi:serine phosphatase RsbU (regulator of sigma subunit)/HAMP domain-containing protein